MAPASHPLHDSAFHKVCFIARHLLPYASPNVFHILVTSNISRYGSAEGASRTAPLLCFV
ncbi:uncharacterized protein BDW43DRAFT_288563 [Aspergillus alliaceus]|uniref:uncharacterized protein n=1 Tax=Petromyces alliaceus TaxID=209559 RepID=UPI0012A47A56|nr:uncharacterized protein BDW43DRAFT_288563 [Aspergillus alliaceus]KAB8229290.1 hypothetical protein BDW43DRAFT_288563 [Aspergillus alliaceus]